MFILKKYEFAGIPPPRAGQAGKNLTESERDNTTPFGWNETLRSRKYGYTTGVLGLIRKYVFRVQLPVKALFSSGRRQ